MVRRPPREQLNPAFLAGLLVACLLALTSQQHASVSLGRICTDSFTCCHTETEVADPTFYLIQSQYTDTWPTSPSVDPIMPGAWQGSHWSANFKVTGMARPGKILSQEGFEPLPRGAFSRSSHTINGVTRGVTVSTCAFLVCHQCYCAGSSLTWGLNLRALVCGIF